MLLQWAYLVGAVPLSGIIIILGGLGILLGYKAKLGAWLLVIFLVPVNIIMHPLGSGDQMQFILFMKDLTGTGAALIIAYFGAEPLSIDAAIKQRKTLELP